MFESLMCNIWWFLAGLLVGVLLCCWMRSCCRNKSKDAADAASSPAPTQGWDKAAARAAGISTRGPDDLKVVEGIGEKTEALLKENGIHNWQKLAVTPVEELRQILSKVEWAGLRLASAESWPEQAALARDGRWATLKELQDKLVDGVHVDGGI